MSRYDADDIYCYPGTSVLKNKLNIKNQAELDAFEADITLARLVSIQSHPIDGTFDFNYLKAIHYQIFQDIYEWAGEVRRVDILRENSRFANVRMIEPAANRLFSELAIDNFLQNMIVAEFSNKLAHYLSEINVLHPFRDGNGRTQRVFISQLARHAGYQLNYFDLGQDVMYRAMEKAFFGDEEDLSSLIAGHLIKI